RVQKRLKRSGGTVFGVTYKDAPDASRAFVRQEKATWPNVRDDRLKLAPKYGTSQLPETFVIAGTGKVAALPRFPPAPPAPSAKMGAQSQASFNDIEDEVMCDVCGIPLNIAESPRAE